VPDWRPDNWKSFDDVGAGTKEIRNNECFVVKQTREKINHEEHEGVWCIWDAGLSAEMEFDAISHMGYITNVIL
jgi:hypothetical protein